jgi:hypothetical protein
MSGGDHLRRVLSETGLLSGGGIRWTEIYLTAGIVLVLAILTAALLSTRNARKRGESVWNTASRQLLISMMVPLSAGGLLIVILIHHGLPLLAAPLSLIFYGIALFSAGKFTYRDVQYLGALQILLGLLSAWIPAWSLILWAAGFGVLHIIYGLHMHIRYER